MKKIIGLLLAMLMLISLAVPAFASPKSKLGTNEDTGEHYEEFSYFSFSSKGSFIFTGQNFVIESNKHDALDFTIRGGNNNYYVKVYPKEDKNFIITRVEANVASYANDYGKVGVTAGTNRENHGVGEDDIVHVDNINVNEFAFANGEGYVGFDMVRVYYECAGEHTWDENDKCEICGICKCKVTGEHKAVLACSLCGEELSEEELSSINGVSSVISDGNISIMVGIVCLAVGLGGGYFIGKKKEN